MKFVNVLFVVLLYCTHLSAQVTLPNNLYFTHIGVEDGLCQNTVCCILQDHLGFIWLGTKDGLTRYDGYRLRVRINPDNHLIIRVFCFYRAY